jgi:hypothetical protein
MNDQRGGEIESFAEGLREAHQRLRGLSASEQEKARLFRRLTVIADAAKHDVTRATARLERFMRELDAGAGEDTPAPD